MFYYFRTSIRERWPLFLVVIIILSCLSFGYMGSRSLTERIVIQTKADLEENWRYQYDILVLPEVPKEIQGLGGGWVSPQSIVASYGGISMDELEVIRNLPGIKVAAPISLLGYVPLDGIAAYFQAAEPESFHVISTTATIFDGLYHHKVDNSQYITEYNLKGQEYSPLSQKFAEENGMFKNFMPPGTTFRFPNELMLIAIDPVAEEEVYTLSESLVEGNTLENENIEHVLGTPLIPIIVLKNQQSLMEESVKISKIEVPEEVRPEDFSMGARDYLESLPTTEVVNLTFPSFSDEWRYKNLELELLGGDEFKVKTKNWTVASENDLFRYSPIHYTDAIHSTEEIPTIRTQTMMESNIYHSGLSASMPRYRSQTEQRKGIAFGLKIIDQYDSNKITPKIMTSYQAGNPIDIYTPHHSMIIEDGAGNKIDETPLLPLPYKDTYYTGSPDAITSLNAAGIFYGDKPPISSIRVIVDGISERSDESQRKIEEVAKAIMDTTGHRVEIMLGSASGKVHVDLNTNLAGRAGVVEEGWQKAGVSWSIEKQVEETNILLFIYLLLISFIFCYTVITHSLLKRSVEFAMLRAVGWTRKKIVNSLLIEVIMLSIIGIVPMFMANLWLNILSYSEIFMILFIVIFLIAIGYLTGSRKALKLSPRAGLEGEGTQWRIFRLMSIKGLTSYVLHQLMRRPLRFGLLTSVLALTTFMSILFVATQQTLSDFLFLSFLGETIDLNLQGFQTAFLIAGLFLTITIIFLLLYLNITERKKEFFVLRSIGWSLIRIQIYMGMEALMIAFSGSIIGVLSAYLILTQNSDLLIPIWTLLLTVLIPIILLIVFSIIIVRTMNLRGIVKDHFAA